MGAYLELTDLGLATRRAAVLTGVPRATATRLVARDRTPDPEPAPPRPAPVNKLTAAERAVMLATLNSDEFVDKPPLQVYAILLERGEYVGSVSTMYRVLRENTQIRERRRQASHPPRKVPELIATGPGQVYSWDITKLAGPAKGVYYDAYVMIDIFSRYIVGAIVHSCEDGVLAKEMMLDAFGLHSTPEVVHSDGGPSMTSKTVRTLLADLGVTASRSRPHVSNDNPYSEALFKTMKYLPVFPDRFGALTEAREFLGEFVHATEDGVLAKEMMLDAFGVHGTPEVVHSDGGPSMTSKTVRTLLADLGVTASRSRPHVSNDNPYSPYVSGLGESTGS